MTKEHAVGLAAQCWCEPETKQKVMDSELAFAFAKKLKGECDSREGMLEYAWTIICNAGAGNWERESLDWQTAAAKFCDDYHKLILGAP